MKRLIYFFAVLPLLFTSCNKEEKVNNFAGYWYSDYKYKPDAQTGFVSFVLRFDDVKAYKAGNVALTFDFEDLGEVRDFYGTYNHNEWNSHSSVVEIDINGKNYLWEVMVTEDKLVLLADDLVAGESKITFSRR